MKYKLIKTYPGSPELGEIVEYTGRGYTFGIPCSYYFSKEMVEDYPEFWEKIQDKNWVITGGKINATEYSIITQVTRLPDYVKFEIGDKVYNPKSLSQNFTIEKFYLDCNNEHMLAGPGHVGIHKIEHYKEPLLITEDGKEIKYKDTFYTVETDGITFHTLLSEYTLPFITFSSYELAEKYYEFLKPKFNKKELMDIIDNEDYNDGEVVDRICKLIESK